MPLLSVNGTTLFCDVTGPADAPPLVFSNSLGTTLEMWDAQVRALAGRYRLIRYDTQNGQQAHLSRSERLRRVLRPRVLIYSAVLLLICTALATSLWLRSPFRVDVDRDRGAIARTVEDGWVENVYRLQIMNTTEEVQRYRVRATGLPELVIKVQRDIRIGPAEALWLPLALRLPPEVAERVGAGAHKIEFTIERVEDRDGDTDSPRRQVEKSTFMVPR